MISKQFFYALVKRFIRLFIIGGLAQLIIMIQSQQITSWEDFSKLSIVCVVAFLTGGLASVEKAARYDSRKETK